MKNINNLDELNVKKLTTNEAAKINGGGGFWEVLESAKDILKDVGENDEWIL